jgi:hypothetical protein
MYEISITNAWSRAELTDDRESLLGLGWALEIYGSSLRKVIVSEK